MMVPTYDSLLAACLPLFAQSRMHRVFIQLVTAWLLCTSRRTLTGLLGYIPCEERRPHDTYHRFVRSGAWLIEELFDLMTRTLVRAHGSDGLVTLDLDDTLHHKTGRKVAGAGIWRDAVRSTSTHVVYALGLNLIVLTLRITPPWGGLPLALPVRVRVHEKDQATYFDLALEMLQAVAVCLPGCRLRVCADGFYAALAPRLPRDITLTSRLRSDAALYELPAPQPKGKRGRKPTKGPRLPKLAELAAEAAVLGLFSLTTVTRHGAAVERWVYSRIVRWDGCTILVVIVRDPDGHEADDYFFTTDLDACYLDVPDHYAGRWSIEITFRDVKQLLGAQEPQSWAGHGPARIAALAYWLYSLVWHCFLLAAPTDQAAALRVTPWFREKRRPSFADALAWLRQHLWWSRIKSGALWGAAPAQNSEDLAVLVDHLARAA